MAKKPYTIVYYLLWLMLIPSVIGLLRNLIERQYHTRNWLFWSAFIGSSMFIFFYRKNSILALYVLIGIAFIDIPLKLFVFSYDKVSIYKPEVLLGTKIVFYAIFVIYIMKGIKPYLNYIKEFESSNQKLKDLL